MIVTPRHSAVAIIASCVAALLSCGSNVTQGGGGDGGGGDASAGGGAGCAPPTEPETLHPLALEAQGAVVATATDVYWIELAQNSVLEAKGVIFRTDKCGGGARFVVDSALRFPMGLATYAGDLFWTELGTNENGSVTSGRIRSLSGLNIANNSGPDGVASDGTNVFWTSGGVFSASLSGGMETQVGPGGEDVVVDDVNVYWITYQGGIDSAPKDGGPVSHIATGMTGPCNGPNTALIADGDELFWANCGRVRRVSKQGTQQQNIILDSSWPGHGATGLVAVDQHWVYWSQNLNGLKAMARDGSGTPVLVANATGGSSYAGGVFVDDSAVYWADGAALRRLPKLPQP